MNLPGDGVTQFHVNVAQNYSNIWEEKHKPEVYLRGDQRIVQ